MSSRRAVLLVNLGSPDSTAIPDVRKYLDEFLMDERVIDYPWLLRWLVIKLFVLPSRPHKSAHAYEQIWTPEGSPLVVTSRRLSEALAKEVELPVELGMRYGSMSIAKALERLRKEHGSSLREILLIPLYPHYAMSSYETVVEKTKADLRDMAWNVDLQILPPFYKDPLYLQALEQSIREGLPQTYDHLLFSYHGIPVRHLKKGDCTGTHCMMKEDCCSHPPAAVAGVCYRHQSIETTRILSERLGIPHGKVSSSFQSRFGREVWCTPYTDAELKRLPTVGVKKLVVVCPAFVADCLETLEEIGMQGRETFMEAGGESFTLISCLNTHPLFVQALKAWSVEGQG